MKAPFKVVIAYEEFEHGIRAREMIERLLARLPSPLELESEAWSFQWFGHPEVRHRAARVASGADMIVLSARSAVDLPDGVREWLAAWLPQKKEGVAALVALIEEEEEQDGPPSALRTQLLQMATEASVDFFWHTPSPNGGNGRRLHSPPLPTAVPDFDDAPAARTSARGWGINE